MCTCMKRIINLPGIKFENNVVNAITAEPMSYTPMSTVFVFSIRYKIVVIFND